MIKKFKLFETLKKGPVIKKTLVRDFKIGSYVICESKHEFEELNNFTLNNVGQIIDVLDIKDRTDNIVVNFDYIPYELINGYQVTRYKNNTYKSAILFTRWEIKYLSDDKSELESIIAANKFNI